MALLAPDPLTQLAFSVYENPGVFALLLGSGLSRAADIPTGWEITLDLVRRVAAAKGVTDQQDWAAWHRLETGEEPNYSVLLEELASSPEERRAILNRYIEPSVEDREAGRKTPTKAHYAVADLVRTGFVRVIVTTNFDRLIETALRERGIEPTVVASRDALRGAEPLTHTRCYVLKLHGDYKDARILNTDAELSSYPSEYDQLLDRIFDEHGLILAGWSGAWDHALRRAMLRAPTRRYSTFWAARGELTDGAKELVDHRKARVLSIDEADTFFHGLRTRVEALEQTHRQSPLTADLAMSSAKRFLARPEHRIQLGELVGEHTARMLAAIEAADMPTQGSFTKEEYVRRLARYEAASEVLAKVVGVLGRWGEGPELTHVIEAIEVQYAAAQESHGGLVIWLNIRAYPAVLLFTAYALGLVRASRWETLNDLFQAEIARDHRGGKRVVEDLFANAWDGSNRDYWRQLEGYERRHTPFSDYQCQLFSDWAASFAPLTPDFELLFERFELLASLAYLQPQTADELQLANSQGHGSWLPFGRVAWDSGRRERLFEWLRSERGRADILAAGFCRGDPAHLDLGLERLAYVGSRLW